MRESSNETSRVRTKSLTWVWILLSVIIVITLVTLVAVFYYGESGQDMMQNSSSQAEEVSAGSIGSLPDGSGDKISLSSLSCDSLDSVFRDTLDCCGAGQGSQRCEGVNQAHEMACGGPLTCQRPEGRLAFLHNGNLGIYDVASDTYEYITSSGDLMQETTGARGEWFNQGTVVVRDTNREMVTIDLSTGERTPWNQATFTQPSIDDGVVAFNTCETLPCEVVPSVKYLDLSNDDVTHTGLFSHDGPKISEDYIALSNPLRIYQISTGEVTEPGEPRALKVKIDGNIVVYVDGNFIKYYDITSSEIVNTGFHGDIPAVSGSKLAFATVENLISTDLNGDGDTDDTILRVYDIDTDEVFSTGIRLATPNTSRSILSFENNLITYFQDEANIFEDVNGDGDTVDQITGIYDVSNRVNYATSIPATKAYALEHD